MLPQAGENDHAYGIRVFQAGRERLPIHSEWDTVRAEVMYRANRAKFASNADLRADLLSTGNAKLAHPDAGFWGEWNALVMTRIREELRPEGERNQALLQSLEAKFAQQLGGVADVPIGLETYDK